MPPLCTNFSQRESASNAPRIDASLGVGMVGGVKALYAVLLALVLGVGCASGNYWQFPASSGWDSDPWHNDKENKGFFTQEKNWSRGEYIPDRWEAELKYNAGMLSREEFDHYERVRSVYPHKDLKYIDGDGNLRSPDIEISPDGRSIQIREALGDGY